MGASLVGMKLAFGPFALPGRPSPLPPPARCDPVCLRCLLVPKDCLMSCWKPEDRRQRANRWKIEDPLPLTGPDILSPTLPFRAHVFSEPDAQRPASKILASTEQKQFYRRNQIRRLGRGWLSPFVRPGQPGVGGGGVQPMNYARISCVFFWVIPRDGQHRPPRTSEGQLGGWGP